MWQIFYRLRCKYLSDVMYPWLSGAVICLWLSLSRIYNGKIKFCKKPWFRMWNLIDCFRPLHTLSRYSHQNLFINFVTNSPCRQITHVPKFVTPLASITLSSVCCWWILMKYCTLHYRSITYCHTYCDVRTLPCVFSVMSLWRQSLSPLGLCSIRCYWQGDLAVAYQPKTKSLR